MCSNHLAGVGAAVAHRCCSDRVVGHRKAAGYPGLAADAGDARA